VGATVRNDSVLHQSIAVQFENALGRPGGAFIATKAVDDSLATAIAQAMSNDIVFFALDSAGRPHISGSSMPRSAPLARFLDERAPIWAAADAGSPSRMGPLTTSVTTDEIAFTDVTLGETRWVASGAALRSAGGTARGGFVVLRSLDDEMVAFMDLTRWIIGIAGGGLLLAVALSQLVGRRMSRRLQTLGNAAQRVADGDDMVDILVRGGDEVGRLAESVRTVLVDVRDQRALVEFLTAEAPRTTGHALLSDLVSPPLNGDGLHPGDKLAGRYEILELVGSGGAGKVYRARDVEIAEPVAVKTLRPELASDSASVARLNAELRIARRISHRNVLRTHELGEADGRHFVAMEWVDGHSVKTLLSTRGRFPVEATLAIARQLCRALQVAHAQGIVHRDLKPHNLIITRDGVLKVTDFGTARLTTRPGHTPTGAGTEYIAPEQRHGEDVDGRADLYAAGVMIYECLTGRTPFSAEGAAQLQPGVDQLPVPPHEIAPEVPRWLSSVVLSALHPNRMRRPKNASEMLRRLAGE
ncbi:MAG: protein kinase, partial [Gemmatimonadota bacterium]|nr:protein kinase [Gemmatimonadota bacterium]